jgi:hypothetical protein
LPDGIFCIPKIPILVYFGRPLMETVGILCIDSLGYFMTIWQVLWTFGIHILWPFGIYFPVLVCCTYTEKSGNPVNDHAQRERVPISKSNLTNWFRQLGLFGYTD